MRKIRTVPVTFLADPTRIPVKMYCGRQIKWATDDFAKNNWPERHFLVN